MFCCLMQSKNIYFTYLKQSAPSVEHMMERMFIFRVESLYQYRFVSAGYTHLYLH